jgi:hypothetical protein
MCLRLEEVTALRKLNHEEIDSVIKHRREWREISRQRLLQTQKVGITMPSHFIRNYGEIEDITVTNLHTFAQILITTQIEFKLITSGNRAWIYTNDPALFVDLKKSPGVTNTKYTRANVVRTANTVQLKNPKYPLRSYFRSVKLNPTDKELLKNFLKNQQQIAGLSPSLSQWVIDPYHRLQDYYFVDHNELWLTMLALVRPGLIRKTVTVVAR